MSANAAQNTEAAPTAPTAPATPAAAPAAPTAVESVTEALASTSIAPKESSAEDADAADAADVDAADAVHAAHAASAAEGRRLYIGNLAYSTTDDQLEEFFVGFDIESTSIPTNPRSGRAVGYAFVDLKTKEEAERAIAELSGKEVLERKVSVQLARKPGTASARRESYYNNTAPAEGQQQEDGEPSQNQGGRRNGFRGRGKRRGRGGRSRASERAERANGEFTEGVYEDETTPAINVLPLTEPVETWQSPATEVSGATFGGPAGEGEGHSGYRFRRRRGPPENGVPSTTKVMVANLPYELSEEKLKELFAEYQPESAKIALRPIPRFMVRKLQARGEPRKGRGFGFVTLASEELQKRAVEEMNGKEVDGREIAVKIAIDNPKIEGENEEAGEGEKNKEVTEGTKVKENGVQVESASTVEATAA